MSAVEGYLFHCVLVIELANDADDVDGASVDCDVSGGIDEHEQHEQGDEEDVRDVRDGPYAPSVWDGTVARDACRGDGALGRSSQRGLDGLGGPEGKASHNRMVMAHHIVQNELGVLKNPAGRTGPAGSMGEPHHCHGGRKAEEHFRENNGHTTARKMRYAHNPGGNRGASIFCRLVEGPLHSRHNPLQTHHLKGKQGGVVGSGGTAVRALESFGVVEGGDGFLLIGRTGSGCDGDWNLWIGKKSRKV